MHLDANRENAIALLKQGLEGPIVMLNLLRFRDAANAGYLAGLGHRTAALLDSRLLPLTTTFGAR